MPSIELLMNISPALAADIVDLVARRTGRARLMITGTSMNPNLRAGMVVEIESLVALPRIGDILVFQSTSGLIAHRYIRKLRRGTGNPDDDLFVTAGDAWPERSETIAPNLVIGRVRSIWANAEVNSARIDDWQFCRRGAMYARTRWGRSLLRRLLWFR